MRTASANFRIAFPFACVTGRALPVFRISLSWASKNSQTRAESKRFSSRAWLLVVKVIAAETPLCYEYSVFLM